MHSSHAVKAIKQAITPGAGPWGLALVICLLRHRGGIETRRPREELDRCFLPPQHDGEPYLREFVHPAVEEGLRKSGRTRGDFTCTYATIGQRIQARYTGLLDRVGLYQPWLPSLADPRWPALVKQFNG